MDGGKSFKFDASADRIPGNLYTVKFFDDKIGWVFHPNSDLSTPAQFSTIDGTGAVR